MRRWYQRSPDGGQNGGNATMSLYRVRPANSPTAGDNRRLRPYLAAGEMFPASAFVRQSRDEFGNLVGAPSTPIVEVQAFRSGLPGGGTRQDANVSLVIDSIMGAADIRLGPDEARAVAEMLVAAALEAEELTEAASREAYLNDPDDDTDGIHPGYAEAQA